VRWYHVGQMGSVGGSVSGWPVAVARDAEGEGVGLVGLHPGVMVVLSRLLMFRLYFSCKGQNGFA
jgi:hypothetical protein